MGGDSSKESNQQQVLAHIESLIYDAFTNASKNKYLTKQEFNRSMKVFEMFNSMNICNTHFASRLFEVVSEGSDTVSKEQVIDKFKKFLTDNPKCNRYSFRMYDSDKDDKISLRDFSDFFEKTWETQSEIVVDKLKNIPGVNSQQLTMWAKQRRRQMLAVASQIFSELDTSKRKYLGLEEFERWVLSRKFDLMVFKYKEEIFRFPLHIDAMINVG